MHGTTMMFLFAVPVMLAMGIYLVPLMVGARNIAFPRLIAFGYWMFLFGGIFLYVDVRRSTSGPDAGWFSYPPLAGPEFGYGKRADVWAQLITFTEVSSLVVATCLDLHHLQAAHARHVAEPHAAVRLGDAGRVVHGDLRDAGGDARQHLPDPRPAGQHAFLQPGRRRRRAALAAPVLVLRPPRGLHHLHPGARHGLGDHRDVRAAAACSATSRWCWRWSSTAFIGFGVWVHHMFATGLPQLGAELLHRRQHDDRDPDRLQIFCWIATIWTARPAADRPCRSSSWRRSSSSSSSAA